MASSFHRFFCLFPFSPKTHSTRRQAMLNQIMVFNRQRREQSSRSRFVRVLRQQKNFWFTSRNGEKKINKILFCLRKFSLFFLLVGVEKKTCLYVYGGNFPLKLDCDAIIENLCDSEFAYESNFNFYMKEKNPKKSTLVALQGSRKFPRRSRLGVEVINEKLTQSRSTWLQNFSFVFLCVPLSWF